MGTVATSTAAPDPTRVSPPASTRLAGADEPAVTHDAASAAVRPRGEPARWQPPTVDPDALPVLIGREQELARLCDALGRSASRPTLITGPPGSGRTLLALHLVQHLPGPVAHTSALELPEDDEDLRAGLARLAEQGTLLIVDQLDAALGEVSPGWLSTLMASWIRGQPRAVWVTTPEALGRLAALWPALRECADVVTVESMDPSSCAEALRQAASKILATHGTPLAADLKLGEVVRLADRHLTGLALPGRALDLLDLCGARAQRLGHARLHRALLHEVVAELGGLPVDRVAAPHDRDVCELETRLTQTLVGHRDAVATVAQLVRRNRAGLGGSRPILSALLLGPSGVGKTELAKALATALFEQDDALIRLDMSEYAESHGVARIVGAPPGYVGYEQGGALTDPLLRRPHCVVLLDEIEKAHRDVHQLLLQVLDEGRLTDGRGRTISFRHAAIFMTSNLGAEEILMGESGPQMDEVRVLARARAAFPVELWNRIEAPLVMGPLSGGELTKICKRMVARSSARLLQERGVGFDLDPSAYEWLIRRAGADPSLGARPLRHLVTRQVEALVADAVLAGRARAGTRLRVREADGSLVVVPR